MSLSKICLWSKGIRGENTSLNGDSIGVCLTVLALGPITLIYFILHPVGRVVVN